MGNNIFLLIGESGSGKTTIANFLETKGYKVLNSYTTRPKRTQNEKGHIFVKESNMPSQEEMVAYTYYNGNHYWATKDQIDENDIYVIDKRGIDTLKQKYNGTKKVVVIKIKTSIFKRFVYMIKRGDSFLNALKRILVDIKEFKKIDADVVFTNNKSLNKIELEILNYIKSRKWL